MNTLKTTLVVGASTKPGRYANKAIAMLLAHNHPVLAFGNQAGEVEGIPIQTQWSFKDIDTVTLYLSQQNQVSYYQKIVALKPRRVIFNPGTENVEWYSLLQQQGIEVEEACTLVLLSTGQF